MSWLFSRALVEEYSAASSWDGEPYAQLNSIPTPQAFLSPDRMTAFSRLSRSGMMFAPLTDTLGEAVLTWFLAGFHVRTSAPPAEAPESTESAPVSGLKWHASLARFDRDSHSWKTVQSSLFADSAECLETWPRSGMTAAGLCWELPMLGRRTSGIGSGLWLPTPDTGLTPNGHGARGGKPGNGRQSGTSLTAMAKHNCWPTPHGFSKDGLSNGPSGNELGRAVNRSFPTPVSTSATGGRSGLDGGAHARQRLVEDYGEETMKELTGGSLNPTWVEWLMGWPLGWTVCEPLATDKFQQWLQQHGDYFQEMAADLPL